jgi:hypothetical protein
MFKLDQVLTASDVLKLPVDDWAVQSGLSVANGVVRGFMGDMTVEDATYRRERISRNIDAGKTVVRVKQAEDEYTILYVESAGEEVTLIVSHAKPETNLSDMKKMFTDFFKQGDLAPSWEAFVDAVLQPGVTFVSGDESVHVMRGGDELTWSPVLRSQAETPERRKETAQRLAKLMTLVKREGTLAS